MRLLAFVAGAAVLAGYAFWIYGRAEMAVRGRRRLAVLRSLTLVMVLALLFDLRVPWGGRAGTDESWVLLDVSRSMAADGGVAWEAARARAGALESDGWVVVPFGGPGSAGDGAPTTPLGYDSHLAPALVRAAEAGVTRLRVLSDLRLHDRVAVESALLSLPLAVDFEPVGGGVENAGISEFVLSPEGQPGDSLAAEVRFFTEGTSDSLQVEIREEGTLAASVVVASPSQGRRGEAILVLPPPRGEGYRRYEARVRLPGDAFPDDDEAVGYLDAGREGGGVVIVSLRPDWEPRALLAVLAEATGLRTTGYLRAGADRFIPMGRAVQRAAPVDSARVRVALEEAEFRVVHGLGAGTDAWGRSLARAGGRTLLWPVDGVGLEVAGVAAGPPEGGEWYPSAEVPASPLAVYIAGADWGGTPPLTDLFLLGDGVPGFVPFLVQRGGTGPARGGLLLDTSGEGRRAVVLASGFWRWAARGGAPRELYRRLWSGVGGWLLDDPTGGQATEVRPERWVFPPELDQRWRVPGDSAETVRLEVRDRDDLLVRDTVLPAGSAAAVRPLPPGAYRYRAMGPQGPVGEGRFDVERRSGEMSVLPWVPGPASSPGVGAGRRAGEGGPLRTSPWPYLVLLVLLSAEWVGRRRVGLR